MQPRWVVLGLVMSGACGGGGDDTPADAPSVDAAPLCTHIQNLKTFRGRAERFGSSGGRFEGMICVDGRADLGCAFADLQTNFELCVPSMVDFGLKLTHPGFEKVIYLLGPQAMSSPTTTFRFTAPDEAFADSMIWGTIGGIYPPTTLGNLVVIASTADGMGLAGAQVAITPSANLTVVYANDMGLPDPNLTATAALGIALITNVPPGSYDIAITSAANPSCSFFTGGYTSPDAAQSGRIPVQAGVTVSGQFKCTP